MNMPNSVGRVATIFGSPSIYLWLLLSISSSSLRSQELDTYSINYTARTGIATASATRSLSKIRSNSYQLINILIVTLAGQPVTEIKEVSEIILSNDQNLIPSSYRKEQLGFIDTIEEITYDWEQYIAKIATADLSTQINLEDDTFDQLSHQLAMRENLTRGIERFSYNVINRSGIREYKYAVLGEESIRTPLGDFLSIKVERMQPADDDRSIVFWLSTEWEGVLLRMDQVINGGIGLTLEIQDGFVNGKTITGKEIF